MWSRLNISKALADAVHRGIINYNPASSAKPPKQEKYKAEFLNPLQIDKLILLFKGSVIEIPIKLCAIYGLRRSEVLGLKWSSVDFENMTLTISETMQQHTGGDYSDTPKTESSYRTLPLTEKVANMLKAHKALQIQLKEIIGNNYFVNDYICTWQDGRPISPNYLTATFNEIIKKSTLPHVRLHDLRHSVASNLLNNGCSVVQVQDWLGHSSPATTLNFYAHVDKSSKKAVAAKLDKMIDFDISC